MVNKEGVDENANEKPVNYIHINSWRKRNSRVRGRVYLQKSKDAIMQDIIDKKKVLMLNTPASRQVF